MLYIRHMFRTQIYLPKELHQELQIVAKKEKKHTAAVIREVLAEGLEKRRGNAGKALLELADTAVQGLPKNLSSTIDNELYEEQ